jgi:hypothetical protein
MVSCSLGDDRVLVCNGFPTGIYGTGLFAQTRQDTVGESTLKCDRAADGLLTCDPITWNGKSSRGPFATCSTGYGISLDNVVAAGAGDSSEDDVDEVLTSGVGDVSEDDTDGVVMTGVGDSSEDVDEVVTSSVGDTSEDDVDDVITAGVDDSVEEDVVEEEDRVSGGSRYNPSITVQSVTEAFSR